MNHNIKPGVATGDQVQEIFNYAKQKGLKMNLINRQHIDKKHSFILSRATVLCIVRFTN